MTLTCPAAVLCFGSMLQVDWQEEADKARRLWLDTHKDTAPERLLQQALSGTDLEQPLGPERDILPEQSGRAGTHCDLNLGTHEKALVMPVTAAVNALIRNHMLLASLLL